VGADGRRAFGVYVHVPWCAVRCGYCDFNTYLPGTQGTATPEGFGAQVAAEARMARQALGTDADLTVDTVFFGGGTPTLLPAQDLVAALAAIDSEFGLAQGAEVTTEANPESVDHEYLQILRAGGFNRISFGMQSAVPQVLATLDRVHTPGRAVQVVEWARQAGFEQVSVDLIYGTPGETDRDWRTSLEVALSAEPTHVSAYSLTVESGTALARRVSRGELAAPDGDTLADRYAIADDVLSAAGLNWYEISNWAVDSESRCRHNLGYWRGQDWWGIGPGAHSHVDGFRWWNVKSPQAYAGALNAGEWPAAGWEELSSGERELETVMLQIRLVDGLLADSAAIGRGQLAQLASQGLIRPDEASRGRLVLTRSGRLLADRVVSMITI